MSPTPSFAELLAPFAAVMTHPSYRTFGVILTGWLFCRRHTITGAIQGADAVGTKHHSAFHRFFATARWAKEDFERVLVSLIVWWLRDGVIVLAVDDTLAPKCGSHVHGAGIHRDALRSSHTVSAIRRGHCWVTLAVIVRLPFRADFRFALPIMTRLYRTEKSCRHEGGTYFTKPELALQMVTALCARYPERRFHLLGDGGYSNETVVKHLPATCDFTGRMCLNAALFDPPPPPTGKRGRPPEKGDRLPTPQRMIETATAAKAMTRFAPKMFGCRAEVFLTSCTALWHSVAGTRLLRIVVTQPLPGTDKPRAFFTTAANASAVDVLVWYAHRWAVENTFHDAKGLLGFSEPQGWTEKAVHRTAPMILYLYSLIVLWFAHHGSPLLHAPGRSWYRQKRDISFADMLIALREETLKHDFRCQPMHPVLSEKYLDRLIHRMAWAA